VTLPEARWRSDAGLRALVDVLGGGETTRAVGGSVRDTLLGLAVSDVDLATRLLPDEVIAQLEAARIKAVPTGIAHGTVTAVVGGKPIEVTTLRRDVATDGRRATVAFSDDWHEDAARRDFTINALYADVATGVIDDYFGGLADLQARRVRFIGDALTRIAEDRLRILRFFRFHARFGTGDPDPEGLAACTARANDLMALSRERVSGELLKLLAVDDPVPTVATMIAQGILKAVLPEFDDVMPLMRCVAREAAAGVAGDPVRRLAALVDGRADLAASLGGRLKLSNAVAKRLVIAAGTQDGPPETLVYRLGHDAAVDVLLLGDGAVADVETARAFQPPKLPVGGGDLIARGLVAGPVVAATLAQIEARWVDAGFPAGDAFDAIVSEALARAG